MLRTLALSLVVSLPLFAQTFKPPCTLPFDDIAEKRGIDSQCGAAGQGSPASQIQNRAKNNYCATGDPVLVTFFTFKQLQKAVEANNVLGPKYKVPDDRDMLKKLRDTTEGDKIGEGTVVQFAAFIGDAHYSNVSSGETVNCKLHGRLNNDIHIELQQNAGETDKCKSVTAEMPPHFRPDSWASKVLNDIGRPVRITGQLFFDASHHPCTATKKPLPKRSSAWEVHPVYNVEVCKFKSLATCKAADDTKWMTLDEFLNPVEDSVEEEADEADT
jgi:hypothetical protein